MTARNIIARDIHRRMVDDNRFGYSWGERWGASNEQWNVDGQTFTMSVGDYDCSSSTIQAWRKALLGTKYAGALDGATYTGNMRSVFTRSGLFEWKPMSFLAEPGDLYLNESSHVAMCYTQHPDILTEFCINEFGGTYGGQRGDQTGGEAAVHNYYDYPWDGILHYNGKADGGAPAKPKQNPGQAYNNAGLHYRVHVSEEGWLDSVRDGQQAGTTGNALAVEALKISPPSGMELTVKIHIQGVGWKTYTGIDGSENSGTKSSPHDPVIGTTGQSRGLQAIEIVPTKNPKNLKLSYRVHVAEFGWGPWIQAGYTAGTTGIDHNIECLQIRAE